MKHTQLSPDAPEGGSAATATKKSKRAAAKKTAAKSGGESAAVLHLVELFKLVHVDLASYPHAMEHARALCGAVTKASPLLLFVFAVRGLAFVSLAVAFVMACVHGFGVEAVGGLSMAVALDVQSFTVTAPGAAGAAMTACTGDASAVRNAAPGSRITLIGAWCKAQAVGFSQIVFPSGNDTTRNIRWRNVANQPGNMLARGIGQTMEPQDPLTLTQAGSAVAGQNEMVSMLMFYENLPGVDAQMIDNATLLSRAVRLVTVEDTVTATVLGAYGGSRAMNAASDLLRANTQYAILGAKIGIVCQALTIKGPDTGNLRVALPGLVAPDVETVNWFPFMSEWFGLPLIPTFNSANKTGTFIECLQDQALTAVPFSLLLAELAPA